MAWYWSLHTINAGMATLEDAMLAPVKPNRRI